MEGCSIGCLALVVIIGGGVVTCSAVQNNKEVEQQREAAYQNAVQEAALRTQRDDSIRAETERQAQLARAQIAQRNARVMEFVETVNPMLVDRLKEIRRNSNDFTHLISRAKTLMAQFPEHESLQQREASYRAARDSLNHVGDRIQFQLTEAYLHHELLKEQGGFSFPVLTDSLLHDANDVLNLANEIKKGMEEKTFEVENGH